MRGRLAALALTLGLLLTGCAAGSRASGTASFAPEEGERLVVYTSHKEEVWWPIVREFEERTGIWVEVETGGTNELLAAASRQEADAPAADVMFGGGVDSLEAYAGLLRPLLLCRLRRQAGARLCARRTGCGPPSPPCRWCSSTTPSWWSRGDHRLARICSLRHCRGGSPSADPGVSGSCFTGLVTLLRAVDGDTDETLHALCCQPGRPAAGQLRCGAGLGGRRDGPGWGSPWRRPP